MAGGFVDYLRMAWGWKSSPEAVLAPISERFTLVGASVEKFSLTGADNTNKTLVGTSAEKFAVTGA